MKKARHVATGKTVLASDVDYEEYYGIFECPECKAALRLRKEYTRSDGVVIGAAFVHPADGTEAQKNCPARVSMNLSEVDSIPALNITNSRGQFHKLLRKHFLKNLKNYSKDGILEYYSRYHSGSDKLLKDIDTFIKISNVILKSPQNGRYLLKQKLNIEKKLKKFFDLKYPEAKIYLKYPEGKNYLKYLEYQSIEKTIEILTNKVFWGIEYLIYEANDEFRKNALNYIFGGYVFHQVRQEIEVIKKIDGQTRFLGFSGSTLNKVIKVISDKELTKEFFTQMYRDDFQDTNKAVFEKVKKFHNRLFKLIINYLINFNGGSLQI